MIPVIAVAGIENVIFIAGFVADARCGLLNLIQLVDDRAPHFLRHRGFHSIANRIDLRPRIGDFVALVAPVERVNQARRVSISH